MKLGINFLHQHRKKLTRIEQTDRQLFRYATFGAVGVVAVACLVLGGSLFLYFSTARQLDRQERLEAAIIQQEPIERSALILASKVRALTELMNQRSDKQQAISYFSNLFGDQVLIKDIDFQSGDGVLSLSLESRSVFVLNTVIDLLNDPQTTSRFTSLSKSNLARSKDGKYMITVTVVLTPRGSLS